MSGWKLILFLLLISFTVHAQPFITNSILAGGVTANSARFWLRTSEPAEVNIDFSLSADFSQSNSGVPVATTQSGNNTAIVNVSGLQPNTQYYYRPVINNVVADNTERSFRTFPAEGTVSNFTFAFGSCQQSGGGLSSQSPPGNIYREVIKHDPQFFIQLGDWGYPDTTDDLPFDNNIFSADPQRVRNAYINKYSLSFPMDFLLRKVPVDYVYDDHDYMNNNASALTSSFFVPFRPNPLGQDFVVNEIPAPAGSRENSINGYIENFPGYTVENSSRGIYHKFSYGNADFFVLDLRSQRSPNLDGFSKNDNGIWGFTPPAGHSILGRDNAPGTGTSQYDWFLSSLLNSKADWKFVVSSVPFNKEQKQAFDLGIALQATTINYPDSSLPPGTSAIVASMELADKWIAFPEDLNGVLQFVEQNNIKNVIVLSGDSHTAAMDDGTNAGFPEIMAGNLDITNSRTASLFEMFGLHIWNKGGQGISTDLFNNAFGKITVSGSDSVKLSLIDESGTEFASQTIVNSVTSVNEQPNLITYLLKQNYPNPFNPSTTIEYTVVENGFVSIKIFDVLGNEITELLNEEKSPGVYKINFDGSKIASGVYYYQLSVNNFIETKKMILIK